MKDPAKVKMGKRSFAKGQRFEVKTRKNLEKDGWIVSKWQNNVDFPDSNINLPTEERVDTKLVSAKQGPFRRTSTGFPDFIAFKPINCGVCELRGYNVGNGYDVIAVECKTGGMLSKTEKAKCKWLLDNNIFYKIYIASSGEKRGSVKYMEVPR